MTEPAKTEAQKEPTKKRPGPKPRIEPILAEDIYEVLKLYKAAISEFPHAYPGVDLATNQELSMQLFNNISHPAFLGFKVRSGRKVIAQVLGRIEHRALEAPKSYLFVWHFHVDKAFRGEGVLRAMFSELFAAARSRGVHSFESNSDAKTVEFISAITKGRSRILYQRVSFDF